MEKLQRFSIRKLTIGAVSCMIGVFWLSNTQTNTVQASTDSSTQEKVIKNNASLDRVQDSIQSNGADTKFAPSNIKAPVHDATVVPSKNVAESQDIQKEKQEAASVVKQHVAGAEKVDETQVQHKEQIIHYQEEGTNKQLAPDKTQAVDFVPYYKKGQITVTYKDNVTNTILSTDHINGYVGAKSTYTTTDKIDAYKSLGYVLDSDSFSSQNDVRYTENPQEFIVGFKHRNSPVNPDLGYTSKGSVNQKAQVQYIDSDNGNKEIANSGTLTGESNDKIDYDPSEEIRNLTNKGYVLIDNGFPDNAHFDDDVNYDQVFTIKFKHGMITVNRDHPGKPGQPINPADPNGPKYPTDTDKTNLEKIATQIVHYTGAGDKTPKDNVSKITFSRTKTIDKVTGEVIKVGNWMPEKRAFETVASPSVEHFTPDVPSAGGETVDPTGNSMTYKYTVNYSRNASTYHYGQTEIKTVKRVINYIDADQNDKAIPSSIAPSVIEEVQFSRKPILDENNQTVGYGVIDPDKNTVYTAQDWTASGKFGKIVSPDLTKYGYTKPDKTKIDEETPSSGLNDGNIEVVTVSYHHQTVKAPTKTASYSQSVTYYEPYKDPNDVPTQETHTVKFEGNGTTDKVTGKTAYGEWHEVTPGQDHDFYIENNHGWIPSVNHVAFKPIGSITEGNHDLGNTDIYYSRKTVKNVSFTVHYRGADPYTPMDSVQKATITTVENTNPAVRTKTEYSKTKYDKVVTPLIDGYHASDSVVEGPQVTGENQYAVVDYFHGSLSVKPDHPIAPDADLFSNLNVMLLSRSNTNNGNVINDDNINDATKFYAIVKAGKVIKQDLNSDQVEYLFGKTLSPKIKNYHLVKPDTDQIVSGADIKLNSPKNWSYTVYYAQDKGSLQVVFHDDTDNVNIPNVGFSSGDMPVGTKFTYTPAQNISELEKKGYVYVTTDGIIPPEAESNRNIIVTVHMKHGVQPITPDTPTPDVPKNTPAEAQPDQLKKEVTLTVNYVNSDGTKFTGTIPANAHQTATFTGTAYVDKVTGKLVNAVEQDGKWVIDENNHATAKIVWASDNTSFTKVISPAEDGYHLVSISDHKDGDDVGSITGLTKDAKDITITVTYSPNGKIIPVDPTGKPIPNAPTPQYPTDPKDPSKVTPNEPVPDVPNMIPEVLTVTPTDPGEDTQIVYIKKYGESGPDTSFDKPEGHIGVSGPDTSFDKPEGHIGVSGPDTSFDKPEGHIGVSGPDTSFDKPKGHIGVSGPDTSFDKPKGHIGVSGPDTSFDKPKGHIGVSGPDTDFNKPKGHIGVSGPDTSFDKPEEHIGVSGPNTSFDKPEGHIGVSGPDTSFDKPKGHIGVSGPDTSFDKPKGHIGVSGPDTSFDKPEGHIGVSGPDTSFDKPEGHIGVSGPDTSFDKPEEHIGVSGPDTSFDKPKGHIGVSGPDTDFNKPKGHIGVSGPDISFDKPEGHIEVSGPDASFDKPECHIGVSGTPTEHDLPTFEIGVPSKDLGTPETHEDLPSSTPTDQNEFNTPEQPKEDEKKQEIKNSKPPKSVQSNKDSNPHKHASVKSINIKQKVILNKPQLTKAKSIQKNKQKLLPQTGDKKNSLVTFFGLAFSALGIGMITRRKRKDN